MESLKLRKADLILLAAALVFGAVLAAVAIGALFFMAVLPVFTALRLVETAGSDSQQIVGAGLVPSQAGASPAPTLRLEMGAGRVIWPRMLPSGLFRTGCR